MTLFWRGVALMLIVGLLSCGILAAYVADVVWRVSVAEAEVMGKSMLIKFPSSYHFEAPPTEASCGGQTYQIDTKLGKMTVWSDKINGFQHSYGSALTAYELGDSLSEKLFCANEWAEWFFDHNGVSQTDILDRRRDLANNKIGRNVGIRARKLGLKGNTADNYIRDQLLLALEVDHTIYTHPYQLRTLALPDEAALGCPYLPERNAFNIVNQASSKAHQLACAAKLKVTHAGERWSAKWHRRIRIDRLINQPPEFSQTS